jgi:hypothetical protein
MLQGIGSGGDRLWVKNHLEEEMSKNYGFQTFVGSRK